MRASESLALPIRHSRSEERWYVRDILLELYGESPPDEVFTEYRIEGGSRVDIAHIGGRSVLLIEAKRWAENSSLAQATRYLMAGFRRWPDKRIDVVVVAKDTAPRLGVPPPGVTVVVWKGPA